MAFDDGDSLAEDHEIEQLLREATSSHLQQGEEVQLNSWDEARDFRARAIQMSRKRALTSRMRRPAKQTRPRSLNYEVDVDRALMKYGIEYPGNLEEVAFYLRRQLHSDAARALRIVLVNLLFGTGGRTDDTRAQIVLEDIIDLYGLNHMRSALLLAMHKHFDDCDGQL